ncbi:interferon-induced GTP-binding protein Mx-like isoform X1 [Alosa alosa]|uniref:interferon-induced GTP-binding protein Mx-like isoform X1 n=1 Tax=Alosa alosa TaxID=278164 RepID=UPI0020153F6D|nr:interferon-induced GTP-binding protein Mx-like isoform X1 [Alosa alosa]
MALPAIAVIGDQSSGKSSVLEALSGVALPIEAALYIPNSPPSDERLLRRPAIKPRMSWQERALGSAALIHLEIMSPDVCDLTLIDLLGITRVPVPEQPDDISDQIVVQRLADQVPMLIQHFLLQESKCMLCLKVQELMEVTNNWTII